MRTSLLYRVSALAVFATCTLLPGLTSAQRYPSQEVFGQNRVQLKKFEWKIFRTTNFEIYFNQGGANMAKLTAQLAENEFDRVSDVLGYTPYERVRIFLYNSPEELSQSNMGIAKFNDSFENENDVSESRIEIAFTGNQTTFRKNLVREISRLFVYEMLYGGNLKDALQSSLLLTLPDWFMAGIAGYVADGWSSELNDYMHDLIESGSIKRPSLVEGKDAVIVGQSIWNYIAVKYGKDKIADILNLTRIIRTEQSSITSTLGLPSYNRFLRDWRSFYTDISKNIASKNQEVKPDWRYKLGSFSSIEKSGMPVSRISIDGKLLAISEMTKLGYKVVVYNTESGKKKTIRTGSMLAGASKRPQSAPLIGWTRNNSLVVMTQERGAQEFFVYDDVLAKKPKLRIRRQIRGLDQIEDMDVSEDGTMLAVSADKNGQNDLFLISVQRASVLPLTTDIFDDLSPRFISGSSRKLVFASNRVSDSLKVKGDFKQIRSTYGLFEHDGIPRGTLVKKIVDSIGTRNYPIAATESDVFFVSDVSGVGNVFRFDRKTESLYQNTTFSSALRSASIGPKGANGITFIQLKDGDFVAGYLKQFNSTGTPQSFRKPGADVKEGKEIAQADSSKKAAAPVAAVVPSIILRPGEVDTDNYQFDEDVLKTFESRQRRNAFTGTPTLAPRNRKRENIAVKGPYPYRGLFINNDGSSDWRIDPVRGFGYSQSFSMNDLLENHVVKAGGFLAFTPLLLNDLWVEYNYNPYRIDFGFRYDRKALNGGVSEASRYNRYRYDQISFSASYPFSNTARFSVTPSYISNRLYNVAAVSGSRSSQFASMKAEFVYDDSRKTGLNMMEGTRLKIRYENVVGISGASEGFDRISVDVRRYQKIHRDVVLAVRGAFGHSGGRSPKLSVMGGMENWVGNRIFHPNNQRDAMNFGASTDNREIFFTEFATNLRGFDINRLSGTSYVLLNAELRVPLVKYLHRGPITSSFLRNLQFTGFTDVGTAWTGQGPFSQENSLNTQIIGVPGSPFRATVTDYRNPYLVGYGLGVRTTLFGIYAKFDYAWGVDNRVVNSPRSYFTLGYDF